VLAILVPMVVDSSPRPPTQDDPEALIPEARERQRRRWLLGGASVAVATVLGFLISAIAGAIRCLDRSASARLGRCAKL